MTNSTVETLGLVHRYIPTEQSENATTLLLLHGTGGDENDLISLGKALAPEANLLSPRGNVLERGLPRFFLRLAEGVFDQQDLKYRTAELSQFIVDASVRYGFNSERVVAVGYSNGANIAASLLLSEPDRLICAILFHPMVPFVPDALPNLNSRTIFIGAGENDPIVPVSNTKELVSMFQQVGAQVTIHWHRGGHALIQKEVEAAQKWFQMSKFSSGSY